MCSLICLGLTLFTAKIGKLEFQNRVLLALTRTFDHNTNLSYSQLFFKL